MIRSIIVLPVALLCGVLAAQPDHTDALERAKAKFEKEIRKADDSLIAHIDKTIVQATKAGNKALQEKLNYERPLFVTQHIIPTAISTDAYLVQRTQATAALLKVYQPVINELTKAKKIAEVGAIEDSLSETLKASREYGLAFPVDLETHPETQFHIENKASGQVIDTIYEDGRWNLALAPKVGKSKPSQCWTLMREEKGFSIWNVKTGECFDLKFGNGNPGSVILTYAQDKRKESTPNLIYRLTEIRRNIVIEPSSNALALTATEKKFKGVTTTYVSQETKESPPSATQLWTLLVAK
jgi:hypothetical protein